MGNFGDELGNSEGEDRFGIRDLFSDFLSRVEWISSGDNGAEGDNGETDDGEEDGVRGEEEDDVAFPDAHGGEGGGDGVDGEPDVGEGEAAAGGGVDEGDLSVVGP